MKIFKPLVLVNLLFILSGLILAREKPNVVLILADDMGYECVNVNGGTDYSTPVLDELAAEGLRFTHCYANAMCTPSRVKLMTGKYNFRNYHDFAHLDMREYTIGNLMRDAGYATFIGGKWQLSGFFRWSTPDSLKYKRIDMQGFDEYCLWLMNLGMQKQYWDPVLEQNGQIIGTVRQNPVTPHPEAYNSTVLENMEKKYGPDLIADQVCDFISRKKDQPFFVYYPMMLPHAPLLPTPDSKDREETDPKKNYTDMVAYADKLVGRIRDHLEKEGVLDNTLFFFTGDNGTFDEITSTLNGESYQGGKAILTNNGTWVPLLVYWEQAEEKGVVIDDLVDFSDFFPTIGEAAGSTYSMALSDGVSFWPRIQGRAGNPREWVFVQHDPGHVPQYKNIGRFARDKKYKLYEDGRFFNLEADIQELSAPLDTDAMSTEVLKAYWKLKRVLSGFPAWEPITKPPKE